MGNPLLNFYRNWYNWRVEFMEEKGLEKEYWEWKLKKGYVEDPKEMVANEKTQGEQK
jgi:hypothetical protein